MFASGFARFSLSAAIVVWVALQGGSVRTQDVQPVNSGANPYRTIRNWGMVPEGRPWGGANGVDIDRDGTSVWVADRCGTRRGCVGSDVDPVQKFDGSGTLLTSFGAGMFVWPHGLHVDQDGNVWIADARRPATDELNEFPGEKDKGSVVVKFSPEGDVLMTLGKFGVAGDPPDALTDPTDVVTAPKRRYLRGRESYERRGSESHRAHLGLRRDRHVYQDDWENRNRAGRVPDAARDRVRFPRPADRRRPPQSPYPDPGHGRELPR